MSHNTLVRASLAAWGADATVTAAEFWKLDENQYQSINGDLGGTWAPGDPIIIGGAGVQITGDFSVSGASLLLDCQGIDLTSGSIDISAGASIEVTGDINVLNNGDINVLSGGEIEVRSGATVDLQAGSTTTAAGAVNVASGGTLSIQSGGALSTSAGSAMALAGDATQLGKWTRSGAGGRLVRRVFTAPNISTIIGVGDCDVAFITMNDGNNRTCTLKVSTGPAPSAGEQITVRRLGTSGALSIIDEGLAVIIGTISSGDHGAAIFEFDGTQWRAVAGNNFNSTSVG